MSNIVRPFRHHDTTVETELRAYADSRGFAQVTLARGSDLMSVRLSVDEATNLAALLLAVRTGQEQPVGYVHRAPDGTETVLDPAEVWIVREEAE